LRTIGRRHDVAPFLSQDEGKNIEKILVIVGD
jgi:hypothetical protein